MKEMVGGCCVCSDEQGLPENPLVYCDGDGCTVAVHQACYGIITVPQGPWFCRRCESQERAAKVVSVSLEICHIFPFIDFLINMYNLESSTEMWIMPSTGWCT